MRSAAAHILASVLALVAVIVGSAWLAHLRGEPRHGELQLWRGGDIYIGIFSDATTLGVGVVRTIDLMRLTDQQYADLAGSETYQVDRWLGFRYTRGRWVFYGAGRRGFGAKTADDNFAVGIPTALAIALLAAFPALHFTRLARRRRRRRNGHCPTCGYDLRGSGPTCPECGSSAPPVSQNGLSLSS